MTEEEQEVVFVTNDSMLRGNGKLDPQDEAVLQEAAKAGKVMVMSLEEALGVMAKEEPGQFAEFNRAQEKLVGRLRLLSWRQRRTNGRGRMTRYLACG